MTTRKKTQKSTQQALNTGAQMFGRQPYTTVEDVKGTPNMVEQSMPPPTKAWTPTNWKQWDEEQQENQYQSEFEKGRRYDTENKPIDTNLQTPLYQMSQQEQINRASESSKKIFSDMEVGMTVSDLIKKGEKDAAAAAREVQSKTSPYVDDNGFSALATLRAANEARTPSKLVKDFQSGLQDKMEYLVYSHSKEIEDGAKDARMDVPTYIDKYVVPQYLSQIETSLRDEVRKGYMPKSDFEYIMSGVKDWVPGMLVRIATQTGEQYALEDEAKQQYGDKASWGVKALNEGMAFVDPTFAGAFGAGRVAGKTIQSAVTSGVNRAVQTKIGQKLAPVAVQKAADYAAKFGTGAQATMAKLIDRSGSSRIGSFLTTYSKELPAEIIGQSLGMNLYGSLSGGVSTYGQTRDIYEAGKVAWEGLTSKEGVASGTAFAIGMPILHNLYGLSGLGWKAGDSLLKKTVMGGAKLAFEGASVLGTAGVMTAGHNLGYLFNGEDMDWTLNTFMEQTTTAAAMKYNPNLLKRMSQWPKMLKNMGSKETNNPLPFRLEKEEVDMILDLTHTETLSDALYTIFPDLGKASGKLRDVDARVTEARKNYLRLMNQLPWDTANKINMLTGSMTIARPRAASYEYNGKKLMEIGEDGSILSVKEVTSREQAEAYIAEKKIAQNNADLVKSWFDAYRNNKDEMDRRVDAFEKEHNLKSGTLYSILLSDPMSRIGTNRELLLEQAAMQMEDLFRPRGKAHVDQSRIDGENVANDADILGATPNVEAIRALDAEVDREQANFESALARAPWRKEYQSLKGKGMSDADALATLSDKYKETDLAPLADFVNAQAKQEGFLSAVGHSVDSKVSERVNTLTYRMDDKGEKVQHDDVIELVDADGNIVHLVGGVSGKTSVVNGKEYLDGDLMVIVDANGETHAVKTSDYSINRRLAKSDYDAEYREALGVKATQIIDPTEKLNPERIKQESLKRESAKEESAKEPLKAEEPVKEELAEEPVKEEKPAEEEPRDERGDLDFVNERVTPDRAVEEIYDRNGLTEAEAGDFVAEKKAEAEKLYTEASNEPVTRNTGEGLSEFAQRKAEYNAKVEGLKRNLEKWNQIETAAERRNMTKTGAELTAMDLDARERDIKRQTEERVDELAKKLGDVEKVYDISEVTNPDALAELEAGRTVYGWYDRKKDKVVLYMPNITNPRVATRTIIHEQVIHRGLSKMFKDYDNVLAEVYDKVMTPSEQKEFYEYVNGPKKGKEEDIRKKQLEAADEWIANNHESLRFKQYNVWSNLISSVRGILRKNGFDVDYTRRDIENLVRDSYRNLEKGGAGEVKENTSQESGVFGNIYTQFKGKAKEAIDFLMKKKDGEAIGALHHKDIGDISIVWGNAKAGLQKIAQKHPEVLDNLQEIFDTLEVISRTDNRIKLESDTHFAVVSREFFGTPRSEWLLTAYEKKETSKPTNSSMDVDSNPMGKSDDTATRQSLDVSSVDKVTAISSSDQKTGSDLTNVSENETRFSKSNENQRIFVSNAEKAVEGIKQEKGTPEQWLKMIEKGEGMKGFYDKMLPSFMNKYGKKWGVKVGEVELPDVEEAGRTMWSVDVTPEMKESVMEGQTMFSKAMETELDKAFNDKLSTLNDENKDKVVFDLGRPSKILLDAGVSDKPMKLYGNKVIKKQKKHGFDISELKGLPSAIADPIAVFDNYNNDVNRSILTELHTEQGNVLAAVTLGKGMDIDVNIIRSVFGKGEENLFDWLKRGMATYINEKKTLDFLHHSDLLSEALKNQESSSDAAKLNKIGELNKLLGEKLYVRTKNFKDWFGDWEKNPKDASKTVGENGEPMTLWHETGNDFTVFNPRHEGAGTRDYLTPFGIFLKPSPSPIGVAREGEAKQMALYANIRKPIEFANRKELDDYLRSNCEGYAQAADAIKNIDAEYGKRLDDAERIEDEAMMDIYRNHPEIWNDDAKRMEAYDKYSAEPTRILEEWKGAVNRQSEALKEITDKFFRDSGHDGIVLKNDEGSFGRKTKTYIAFHPNQVKSATGNVGTFSRENDDIRFSKKVYGGNSGYEGYSMSKRAAEARKEGRFPKTDFKKEYGVTDKALDALVKAKVISDNEWHHTSMYGNKTTFYDWGEKEYADFYAENKKEIDDMARKGDIDGISAKFEAYDEQLPELRKAEEERIKAERDETLRLQKEYNEYLDDAVDIPSEYTAENGVRIETNGSRKPADWKYFWGDKPAFRNYGSKAMEEFSKVVGDKMKDLPSFEEWRKNKFQEQNESVAGTESMRAIESSGTMFSVKTEKDLQEQIKAYASSKEGKEAGWTPERAESLIKETEALINALDSAMRGNSFYDAFADREPTIRRDWRDGEWKPTVTWTRGNIEYKYDMSADLLCVNNEGLEQVLSSPRMIEVMGKIVPYKKDGYMLSFKSDDYTLLYDILKKEGFVVPCKGCFDAAGRLKMLPSVAQKFAADVNKVIDERNRDPKKYDEALKSRDSKERTIDGLPISSATKTDAIRVAVAGDNITEHIDWRDLMSAEGQTALLAKYGGLFRAWQRTGSGRPKDKLLPEPYIGDITQSTATIIAPFGDKTPSFRDELVNVGTGLRRNSHSELRPILIIDELQFARDAFLKNLMMFKYTKDLDDVRINKGLSVKENMSFFPEHVKGAKVSGLDANGDYIASAESVGAREFPITDAEGKQTYDGMRGFEEAKKLIDKDNSLSSVIFSIPHLIKAMTDVPTPSNREGVWGSLIPYHASGAERAQIMAQGLGNPRAMKAAQWQEAMTDYGAGVTNFEAVQNDRFGEGWTILKGKKAGTAVEVGHKVEFVNGKHYYNEALGIHLFSNGYILESELPANLREAIKSYTPKKGEKDWRNDYLHEFEVNYNDKVRELGGDYAYKEAADYYLDILPKLGLIPRFDFSVPEKTFLQMCADAKVDPTHPKLGWKGEGHDWSPAHAESYYSLFCDYGMTDPTNGKWSPHQPVGHVNEKGERVFKVREDIVDIAKDALDRYTDIRTEETGRIDDVISKFEQALSDAGRLREGGDRTEGRLGQNARGEETRYRKDYKAEKAQTEDRLLKGNLRETLGKGYTGFVRNLWENRGNPLYKEMHAYVNKEMQKNGFDVNKGVESYLVSKIGSNDRAFWENVRDAYAEGMKEAGNDWKPNLVDVQYGLWLSSKKGNMNDPLFKAEAVAMRDKIAKSLPPVEVVDGAYVDTDTRFRKPVLTPAAQAARDEYDRRVSSQVSRSREAFIDAMESLRVFQEVVGGKDVEDLKNAYVRENLESSIAHVEWEKYQERINKPLSQAVDKIITYMGVGGREGMKQITDYMIQKHGLERNRVMYVRDAIRDIDNPKKAEQMQTDWDTDQAMLRGLLSSGSISFSEYLDMTDTYIRDNVNADYDPNKNDKSGISTYDSNRKLKGKNVEYDESYIRDLVETFESEIGTSDMQNLWDRVREATGFTLDYSYKSGMITAGARDAMKNMFSFYVPLRGYSAETMEEHYDDYLSGGSGKDLNVIKNAEGRKSEADNPLAYIANMAQGAILSGEKNVTKQHFYRLVEGNDKAPVAISEIWEVKNPQGVWEIATPDLTGARPDEIADIVHTFNEDMRNLQQNGDARIAHYQSAYRFPFEQKAHSEEHIVPVNIGGQRKLIYILADPRVAQALNGKLVNDGTANTFKLGRQALNVMSTFATSYSPEFILSNTSRDTLFANSNIASKENAAYFGKFTKNQAKAAQILSIPNLFSQYYDGTWDKSNYYRRMFAEYMDNGGRTGFIAMSKVEDMKKQLEKELTPNSTSEEVARKVGDFLAVVPGWVEAVNARSENLNRFATYLTSREMGRSEQRSASDAKEVSVNFNRKGAGSATGGVTGAVASYFRNNMMFFNAGMQATELMYRNLSKDKKTAAKTVAFQALVPMAGSAIWAALMTLGDDDKYSQIPHWDRRNNICIPLKDTYIKIPLPVELRAFWGMGDIIAGAIDKKLQTGDNVMYELASQAASVMPLDVMGQNQEQLTKWWHVVEALSPDFVNPVFQANRNMTWNGRPIERDDDFLPAYEKAFANTPTLLVEMSKYAHAKTREGEHTAQDTDLTGWQISPGIVHHFLGSYLTGIYSLTLKTASAGTDIANGEFNVARTPFVSRVLGSYKTGEGSAVIRAKYYKYKKEFDEVAREYNNMANRTNELAMQELLNSARYKRHLVAKGYMGFISKLQELNNQATDPEAKKEISALIDNAMADIVEATDSIE